MLVFQALGSTKARTVLSALNGFTVLTGASVVRFVLLVWSLLQDLYFDVPYTDIDYLVYTDAARFLLRGESPYERCTYRYPPIFALSLVADLTILPVWGKLTFVVGDLFSGVLLGRIVRTQGWSYRTANAVMAIWLFNPFTVTMSTRGSIESVISLMVLTVLYLVLQMDLTRAATLYGLAIYFRMYPVFYGMPAWIYVCWKYHTRTFSCFRAHEKVAQFSSRGLLTSMTRVEIVRKTNFCESLLRPKLRERFFLVGVTLSITLALGALSLALYGVDSVYKAYVFHLFRSDVRHNFSASFYAKYLSLDDHFKTDLIRLDGALSFRVLQALCEPNPQLLILLIIGLKYAEDFSFCLFLQTVIFVTFNKVCTAQYFIWYFCLLPLTFPNTSLGIDVEPLAAYGQGLCTPSDPLERSESTCSVFHVTNCFVLWQAVLFLWLSSGWALEFCGLGYYWQLWLASTFLLLMNTFFVTSLISARLPARFMKTTFPK